MSVSWFAVNGLLIILLIILFHWSFSMYLSFPRNTFTGINVFVGIPFAFPFLVSASFAARFHSITSRGTFGTSSCPSSSWIFRCVVIVSTKFLGRFLNIDKIVFDSISSAQNSRWWSRQTKFLAFTILKSSGCCTVYLARLTQLTKEVIRDVVSV